MCTADAAANGLQFGQPDAGLGNARTAPLKAGGLVGGRAPLRDTEQPVVRLYWLVQDIEAADAAIAQASGHIALPPTEIPGHGTFSIFFQAGNAHGLWQL